MLFGVGGLVLEFPLRRWAEPLPVPDKWPRREWNVRDRKMSLALPRYLVAPHRLPREASPP